MLKYVTMFLCMFIEAVRVIKAGDIPTTAYHFLFNRHTIPPRERQGRHCDDSYAEVHPFPQIRGPGTLPHIVCL